MKTHLTRWNRIWDSFRYICCRQQINFSLLLISIPTFPAFAQIKQWDKTIGGRNQDNLSVIQQTPDGGYILGGTSNSQIGGDKTVAPKGLQDFWIVKLKADGTKDWEKVFGGAGDDALTSLQQTSDGGYIVGGNSLSGISGDKSEANKGITDYWIVKLKANGDKVWDKTFGGEESDLLTSLQQTRDGGYILGGWSRSGISSDKSEGNKGGEDAFGFPVADYWVVKLTADGNKIWDKTLGGTGNDELRFLQQTTDGGYILGGDSNSGISGDKTEANRGGFDPEINTPLTDYWVVKLTDNGSKVWDKTFGGNRDDFFESLQQTKDGGYMVGGHSVSGINGDKSEANRGVTDYWILKLTASGDKVWDKTIGGEDGDYLTSVQQTSTGDYLLGGFSRSNKNNEKSEACRGDYDYWLVKVDASGNVLADKTIGGNKKDFFTSLDFTSDGGYILGGSSESDISGDKTEANRSPNITGGSYDFWVVKVKEDTPPLAAQWNMRYGGAGFDYFTDAIKTSDGGYLAGGYSTSGRNGDKTQASQGQKDFWIVKTDKNGKKLWDKRYGGGVDDYLNRIIQTQDGGYLLAGSSFSGGNGDNTGSDRGGRDIWLVKVDAQGNKQWDKSYGGSGADDLEKAVQLATGEYVLGGYSNSHVSGDKSQASRGGTDYWLVKISATGVKIWDKRYGGSSNETLGSFTVTRDGGFLLGGSSFSGKSGDKSQPGRGNSDYWVVKTDKDGNLIWEKTYGGSGQDEVYSVQRSHGNYLYLAGTSNSGKEGDKSQPSQGGKDYWLVKLDENGNKLWDRSFGGSQDDELRASTFTDEGHYVLGGKSFSEKSGDKTQNNQGGSDYWMVRVDAEGNKIDDQRFGGSDTEELRTVFSTNDGGLLLGGRSYSGVSGDRTQPSQGGMDYWLVKIAPLTTATVTAQVVTVAEAAPGNDAQVQAYPNPFQEKATISFSLPETQQASVKVYDGQGNEVATLFNGEAKAKQVYEVEWNASNKTTGLYFLQLQTPAKKQQQKLLLTK